MANTTKKPADEGFNRHQGGIHDSVKLDDGDITVIAGDSDDGSIYFSVNVASTHYSFNISPGVASRLGRLLVAAAIDTEKRS